MALSFTLADEYAWVLLTCVGYIWLSVFQTYNVSKHRKAAKVEYPQLYAEKEETEKSFEAKKFNCAQRAHQNTLEVMPIVFFCTLFSGLKYPIPAAAIGSTWIFGRVLYTISYSRGIAKGRRAFLAMGTTYLFVLLTTWTALGVVRSAGN